MARAEITGTPSYLLTAKALGQMLSLSKRQVFRLKACGKLPKPVRIGGSVRWFAQEIMDWLAAGAPDRETWQSVKVKSTRGIDDTH